jgi:hypothetical protein
MGSCSTSYNRFVYALVQVGGLVFVKMSDTTGTLCKIGAKLGRDIRKKY